MAINELNHINIRTVKMEETKDFFVDVVGLEIGFRPDFPSHGYWLYCGEVPIVHLSLSDPEGGPRTIHSGRGNGLDHIGLSARDLEGTEKTLSEHGVTYRKCLAGRGRLVRCFSLIPMAYRWNWRLMRKRRVSQTTISNPWMRLVWGSDFSGIIP